jgi:rare lipoprotein A
MKLVKTAGKPAAVALVSFLAACTSTDIPAFAGSPKYAVSGAYRVKGRRYRPRVQPGYDRVGVASWYGGAFHGRRTANGERFDMNALTAAHPTLPLSTVVRVTNLDNGRSVAVRINDRGPFAKNRIIDMSRAGALALGFDDRGTARVRVTVVDGGTLTVEREGKRADGSEPAEPGKTAATSSQPRPARPQPRGAGLRERRRGRPLGRSSYLRVRPRRGHRAAAGRGRSR